MIFAPAIQEAARLLHQGGLIAFPTETYYGLGVDPFNVQALERLFALKQRPRGKPVLVLVADQSQLPLLVKKIPFDFQRLLGRFWPGPLTLVCPARPELPELLTGGRATIGVRQSPEPTAARLLAEFAGPITATSANRSGATPAVTAAQVKQIFADEVDLILDGGPTPGGAGSTLIGSDKQGLHCLREGKISFAEVQAFLSLS
ncbi:MAG: threonylcarbamoyl-AMP synthase [Candidatus Electrothrix sp. AR3]|nr:threonylcarbamoyl-AMP synthase [Candidatus Electrothrix sp. AR3]